MVNNVLLPSIAIAVLILLADQLSKYIILTTMIGRQPVEVLPFLNIVMARNHGAAFGMLASSSGWQNIIFVAVAIIITVIILAWSYRLKAKDWWHAIALGSILGGAWGNMLDRIRFGGVTDFIDFYVGNWHWYTFNIADIGICLGAFLLIILTLRH